MADNNANKPQQGQNAPQQQQQTPADGDKPKAQGNAPARREAGEQAPPPPPDRNRAATAFPPGTKVLTRRHMEDTIRRGESVIHNGRVISRLEDLPDAAELAEGDRAATESLVAQNEEHIRRLQAQNDRLKAAAAQPGGEKKK